MNKLIEKIERRVSEKEKYFEQILLKKKQKTFLDHRSTIELQDRNRTCVSGLDTEVTFVYAKPI